MVSESADWHFVEGAAGPDEGEGGGEAEGENAAAEEDWVGFALEEEVLGGTGGEEGEDIGDGNLEEHYVHNLSVFESANAQALENAIGIP